MNLWINVVVKYSKTTDGRVAARAVIRSGSVVSGIGANNAEAQMDLKARLKELGYDARLSLSKPHASTASKGRMKTI